MWDNIRFSKKQNFLEENSILADIFESYIGFYE